jgi:hypothetical protein
MKPKFNRILVLLLALITQITFAQDRTVSGTVSDNSGQPLPGVSVILKGTQNGTQTDLDGKYAIKASATQTLVFSYIGTETQELKASSTTVNVRLKSTSQTLEEVVVVGYGTQKKKDVTGSISCWKEML